MASIRMDLASAASRTVSLAALTINNDSISDRVYALSPYSSKGQRTLKNAEDGIFTDGGDQMLLKLTKNGQGYAATFDVGLQMA